MRRVRRNKRPRAPSAATIAKPTIAIVGAGRVGRALGRRLHEKGWRIGPVITRSMRSARASAAPHRKRHAAGRILGSRSCGRCDPDRHARSRHRRYGRSTGAAWRTESFAPSRRAAKHQKQSGRGKVLARENCSAYQRRAGQRCSRGRSRFAARQPGPCIRCRRSAGARSLRWLVPFAQSRAAPPRCVWRAGFAAIWGVLPWYSRRATRPRIMLLRLWRPDTFSRCSRRRCACW